MLAEKGAPANGRRARKRNALNTWRAKNRERYNAYIREWRAKRKARVAEPRAVLAKAAATKTTTVEIDEGKFASAREILGTRTLRETVDRSFDEVLARAAREQSIRRLQAMEGLDLDKP